MSDANPSELVANIKKRATELGFKDEEFDDYVESRMRRAGFKRGPGDWIGEDDDDGSPRDDDDEPMTRGDWRKMRRDNARKSMTPPKKTSDGDGEDNSDGKKPRKNRDPWW